MREYHNPHTNERYVLRPVPLDEARKLRDAGTIFYDNTKLVAVNTCPTFGVLRYAQHRTETALGGRNLAIECGSACHDFFAALRMWTLTLGDSTIWDKALGVVNEKEYLKRSAHGIKLFGIDRWNEMAIIPQDSDRLHNAINFALSALHTSGYFDDPNDRNRTMANMEVACITYAHRYLDSDLPVYVKDDFIGVEIPFVVEIKRYGQKPSFTPATGVIAVDNQLLDTYYYCGRIDGVHVYGNTITAGENKTASRINDVWRQAFHMSTQPTGYNIALSAILNHDVTHSLVMGVQIPPPARDIYSGVSFENITRTLDDKLRWFEWFFHSVAIYENYTDPTTAPRYTHSCNRYFSICQFLPFCTMSREEQADVLNNMRVDAWDPLSHVVEAKESDDA